MKDRRLTTFSVMAALEAAIQQPRVCAAKTLDDRVKPGHDAEGMDRKTTTVNWEH